MRSIARGEQQREPQAAVAREALLRREVVDVERPTRRPACRSRPRCRRPRRAPRCGRVGAPEPSRRSTSRCAGTRRRRRRRDPGAPGVRPGAVSHTCGSSRCGAARVTAANFDENSPITRCVLVALDQAEHGRVPEERGAAVADQHLVAVGEREQLGEPAIGCDRRHCARRPCGGWCRGSRARRRRARRPPRCGTFDGPEPKRPSRGAELGGYLNRRDLVDGCAHRITLAIAATDPGRVSGSARPSRRAARRSTLVTGRRETEELELARRGALGELDPARRRRLRLRGRVADPVVARDRLNARARRKRAVSGRGEVDAAVEHVAAVREERAADTGRRELGRVQLRIGLSASPRHTVVARSPASDRAHEVRRRVAFVDVGEVEERLEVPTRRRAHAPAATSGSDRCASAARSWSRLRTSPTGGFGRAGCRSTAARVPRSRRSFGCTHSRFIAPEPANGNCACQMCWSGRKPGPFSGHTKPSGRAGGVPEPALALALGVGVVRLRRREHLAEVGGRGVDVVGRDESLEQHPAVVVPRRDVDRHGPWSRSRACESISSKPARRHSSITPASGTAVVSVTTPMQQCRSARSARRSRPRPPVARTRTCARRARPPRTPGTGAPGTLVATKSQHFNIPPNSEVVVAVGSGSARPRAGPVSCSAGSARHCCTSARTACTRSCGIGDRGRHREARGREVVAARCRRPRGGD